jgi:dTMP kinase
METKNKKGKFIVIDGTDGSGKGTQTELLVDSLKSKGLDVITMDFPQYGKPSCFFVEKYLRGEYGTADEVGAKRASLFYALDRLDVSKQMRDWLDEGKIIVSNRYVSANMGHQTGKIKNQEERDKFLDWLNELEFEICGVPRPNEIVFLYMPPEMGQKLVDQKSEREYTQGKKRDIHEADLDHLKNASDAYRYVANKFNWKTVECVENGEILTREQIHQDILKVLEGVLD